jgi:transposase InsO family protein
MPWIGIGRSKYQDWVKRFGKVNEHNAWVPRDHWLTEDEIMRICNFARAHPNEGYRRMTFMMLDADVVACSPASVYRVLKKFGLLAGQTPNVTKKGTGFVQPLKPHQEWHVDISYLNIAGTFYFLCAVLDGYSRFIVHWEIRENMAEGVVETIILRAKEQFPNEHPRIISDNGPQFIAKDFKEFIRIMGMTHVRTSPYYPQSNGKIERFHKTIKGECIRLMVPLSLDDARRLATDYITHYNEARLHSAIGYVTPKDKLLGNDAVIFAARDRKLTEARERRKAMRQTRHEQIESVSDPARPACHHDRPGAHVAGLRATLRPRRPATRCLSLARLDHGHRSLLQRQHQRAHVPLLQVQPLRQRPGVVGRRQPPVDLRRRPRPVPAPEHPAADPGAAANREQRRGNRSHWLKHLYNPLSVSRDVILSH